MNNSYDFNDYIEEKPRKKISLVTAILMAVITFFLGAIGGSMLYINKYEQENKDLQLLREVMAFVDEHYYQDVSYQQQVINACKGVVGSLDSYSYFATDDELVTYSLAYIGVTISYDVSGDFRIRWVNSNSSAYGKIAIGEYITSVNGTQVSGYRAEVLAELLSSKPEGTSITLGILDINKQNLRYETLTYSKVSVEYAGYVGDINETYGVDYVPSDIGYIYLSSFNNISAVEQMQNCIDQFNQDNKKYLILDLRGNGGGSSNVLCKIAEYFVTDANDSKSTLLVTLRTKNGMESYYRTSDNKYIYKNLPRDSRPKIVVLTNESTASASEALIGNMLIHGTGVIVGDNTYGKSVAQTRFDGEGFSIVLTSGYYYFDKDISPYIPVSTNSPVYQMNGIGFRPIGANYVRENVANILTDSNAFVRAVEYLKSEYNI